MSEHADEKFTEYVTATIAGQSFGLPIARIQDVFIPERLTPVPLSGPEIAGLLNLRGRIVTAIDMPRRLGLAARAVKDRPMAVGIEANGESYGLLIDAVGEVMKLADGDREDNPVNLDPRLAAVSSGVYRLEGQLMIVLDVDRVVDLGSTSVAA